MKRALNINKGNVHYIVDLNYKDIFKDRVVYKRVVTTSSIYI